mmetsp:Transcript_57629/g.134898  ORF Transcript_57629/g.134898 Transcript_57629/m.134898 type:complete len:152 (-) Transcript_57629:173-628(-)
MVWMPRLRRSNRLTQTEDVLEDILSGTRSEARHSAHSTEGARRPVPSQKQTLRPRSAASDPGLRSVRSRSMRSHSGHSNGDSEQFGSGVNAARSYGVRQHAIEGNKETSFAGGTNKGRTRLSFQLAATDEGAAKSESSRLQPKPRYVEVAL